MMLFLLYKSHQTVGCLNIAQQSREQGCEHNVCSDNQKTGYL